MVSVNAAYFLKFTLSPPIQSKCILVLYHLELLSLSLSLTFVVSCEQLLVGLMGISLLQLWSVH